MAEGSWVRVGAIDAHLDAGTMNKIIRQVLQQKTQSITKDPELRQMLGIQYLRVVSQFVPRKTGKLVMSGRATDDGRVYWTATSPVHISEDGTAHGGYNYADVQYQPEEYGLSFSHYTTPGTGPHWTDRVRPGTRAWSEFVDHVADEVIRRAK